MSLQDQNQDQDQSQSDDAPDTGAIPTGDDASSDDAGDSAGATGATGPAQSQGQGQSAAPSRGDALEDFIQQIMQYGMQKHGLLGGQGQQQQQQSFARGGRVPSFDEGGAIPDDNEIAPDDDQSGAAPQAAAAQPSAQPSAPATPPIGQTDAMGAMGGQGGDQTSEPAPNPAPRGVAGAAQGAIPATPDQAVSGAAGGDPHKRALAYLMGADAMPAQIVAAIKNAVDPKAAMPPGQRTMEAAAHAASKGGDDAAWAVVQSARTEYDASKSFAAAAFDKGNIPSALDAANRAVQALPMAQHVNFSQGQEGAITATVTGQNGEAQAYTLAPIQFQNLLKGKAGQFDKVMAGGLGEVLNALGVSNQQADQAKGALGTRSATPAPAKSEDAAPMGEQPIYTVPDDMKKMGVTQAMWNVGMRRFSVGQSDKMQDWLIQQANANKAGEDKKEIARIGATSKENVAGVQGQTRIDASKQRANGQVLASLARASASEQNAQTRAAGNVEGENVKLRRTLAQELAKTERSSQDAQIKARAANAQAIIKGLPLGLNTDDLEKALNKYGVNLHDLISIPQSPSAAPAQSAPGQAPEGAGAKPAPKGQWVHGPNGKPVWQAAPASPSQ